MSAMMTAEAASQERIAPIEDCNFILQINVGCGILFKEHTAVISHMAMSVSYNKLWKLLIDKGMSKTQLIKAAKISTNAMAKLGKNEDVRVETLVKICSALGCTMDDIMELIQDPQ